MNMTVGPEKLKRVTADWSAIAGEPVEIKATDIDAPVFAFGSEIACLLLFRAMPKGRCNYSTNLSSWYYSNK